MKIIEKCSSMKSKDGKLGVTLLIFIAIGSMIGSGIFNAPKDLIQVANPLSVLITWIIGGLGAMSLAFVFIYLNQKKPELKSGIFAYARDGFGDYMGFASAWGYWSLGWLGNVSYFLIFFKTLNDILGANALSPLTCFLIASVILWGYYLIILAGVKEGAIINFIVTVAKLLPILLVIIAGIYLFDINNFHYINWQNILASTGKTTTLPIQIKNAMAIVLWCFIGIEAASVLSSRATSMKAVRKATLISLIIVLATYIAITGLTMGSVPAKSLVESQTPLALVLEQTFLGNIGGYIIKFGLMISVIGSSLSWLLLYTETLYAAASDGVLPKIFKKINKNATPINSLLFSQIFTQIFLLSILLPGMNKTYVSVITMGTTLVLIPYLLSSIYTIKIAWKENGENQFNKIIAIIGTIYSIYVIYTVGIKYLLFTVIFYFLGSGLFIWAKKEQNQKIPSWETKLIISLSVLAVIIIVLLYIGKITI